MRKIGRDAVVAVIGLLLIGLFAVLQSVAQPQQSVPSTYDYGVAGFAALYDLLGREGVQVSRFESPLLALQNKNGTFVLAGDAALMSLALDKQAQKALSTWVRSGGRLVLLGTPVFSRDALREALNLPKRDGRGAAVLRDGRDATAYAYTRGKGTIIAVSSTAPFDNAHIARARNAQFAYAVFANGSPIMFDERVFGFANDKSTWDVLPQPVRVAAILLAVALLLGIAGNIVRFAPPVDVSERHVRDTSEYLQSLAAMLRRSGAKRDVVERFCSAIENIAGTRQQTTQILTQVQALRTQTVITDDGVLAAAALYRQTRKDFSC